MTGSSEALFSTEVEVHGVSMRLPSANTPARTNSSGIGAHLLLVWLGGGLGALSRYVVQLLGGTGHNAADVKVWLLLAINTCGCFLIGFLTHRYVVKHQSPLFYSFAITGVLGGFTSFSAYLTGMHAWQVRSQFGMAVGYGILTIVLCLVACAVGQFLASRTDRAQVETLGATAPTQPDIPDEQNGPSTW